MTDHSSTDLPVTVLCGNPRPGSRTLAAAVRVAGSLSALVPHASRPPVTVVDLADLAGELFAKDRPRIEAALEAVSRAGVLVVASPVYKGSYSGLLKIFLDEMPYGGLRGTVAVPLMVMAHPAHTMAADLHLRPLLLELGATVPTSSLVLTEAVLADGPGALDGWVRAEGGLAVTTARSFRGDELREGVLA